MIPRKSKICVDCKKSKPIWAHKRCQGCDRVHRRLVGTPNKPVMRRSGLSKGKVPLRGQSGLNGLKRGYIRPRSEKRMEQEKEYAKIKPENKECIFCGIRFNKWEDKEKHHLKGRDGDLLTDRKYIYYVHMWCHSAYHNKPVKRISWFSGFLLRLREVDRRLYEKELNKYDK